MPGIYRPLVLAAGAAAFIVVVAGWRLDTSIEPRVHRGLIGAIDTTLMKSFRWRSLGPDRGGRSIAAAGVKGRPKEAYFGAVGGGLWKTSDGGTTWAPVTDGQITSASVGAVAVSESNPDIVYIGTGESAIRGNIMAGDGMYKSVNAGKTWTHIGFEKAENISRIRVHPTNPDIVFAAAFGRYGVANEERGVYKSTDGGKSWRKVLYRNDHTAAIDISIDRTNPNVMYAAMWEAFRTEYTMSSGGPGCGLFKSTDGGETWTEITRNPGLPSGLIGRIGVAVSPANPNRVYAIVENEKGGLFRSDDAGATWALINDNRNIRQRAFYYTQVIADIKNADLVYVLNVTAYKSVDGGKTITGMGGTHSDHHDLWIDPDNTQHLVLANDGGGTVSTNGGQTWSAEDFPTPQMYHVAATAHVPYHICGAQQDGSTVCIPSNTGLGGGRGGRGGRGSAEPALYSPGGSEPGYIAPDPKDRDIYFSGANNGGFLERLNRRTGQSREVNPYPRMFSGEPSSALKERWQWTFPVLFSTVDPKVLYTSSQHLWKTTNGGQTWDKISPDLTRHDPKTMGHSGGPITGDMNGPEVYAVIFSIGPSKRDVNVIWTGSDDGLVHVTKDGGKTWANVTPKDMPDLGRVSQIDASAFNTGGAYIAVKRPLMGDYAPYIFKTTDYGKTWTKIVNGIRSDDYAHAVREDPTRQGLLYAATQHGVYYSYDDGANWQSLSLNLPDLPVSDLIVQGSDLAISTQGRGFYILDNISPIRQWSDAVASAPDAWLFAPSPAIRSTTGAAVTYWLRHPAKNVTMEILDSAGNVIRKYGPDTAGTPAADTATGGGRGQGGVNIAPPMTAGVNHAIWDLRYAPAVSFPGMVLWGGGTNGPSAAPGVYKVRLTVDGKSQTQPLVVKRNPAFDDVSDADLKAQFALAIKLRGKVSEANQAIIDIRNVRLQIADRLTKSQDGKLKEAAGRVAVHSKAVEEDVYQVQNQSGQDPLNFPIKINNRLASLLSVVASGDGRPIGNAVPIFNDLSAELKIQTDALARVWKTDLVALNAELTRLGLTVVSPKCAGAPGCTFIP